MTTLKTDSGSQLSGGHLLIVVVPIVLFLLLLWSSRQRRRQVERVQSDLTVGQRVSTTSGLLGTLVDLDDLVGTIEAAPGVRLQFDRRAIMPEGITAARETSPQPSSDGTDAESPRPQGRTYSEATPAPGESGGSTSTLNAGHSDSPNHDTVHDNDDDEKA